MCVSLREIELDLYQKVYVMFIFSRRKIFNETLKGDIYYKFFFGFFFKAKQVSRGNFFKMLNLQPKGLPVLKIKI